MAILWNGHQLKYKILHNSKKMKRILHNGVYKLWSAGNVVTYNVDSVETYKEEVDDEKTCLEPTTFIPAKDGYSFLGWKKDSTSDRNIIEELNMEGDPVSLYAVFEKPVTLTYRCDDANSPKYHSWYKNSGCNHVKISKKNENKCLNFHYDYGNKVRLLARCTLDYPIYFDESIQEKTQYIVIETEFEVHQPYGASATGFEFSIRMKGDDPGNIVLKLEQTALYRHMGSVLGYVKTADYKQGKNHLKIMIDKSNKQTSYFLNDVLVEGNLPSRNKTNPDVGQIQIATPAEDKYYIKELFLYSLKVYELNIEGDFGTVHVDEDYNKYDEGAGLDSTIGVGGVIDCKSIYYNNGNEKVPEFTLIDNFYEKDGYEFDGWDLGEVGTTVAVDKNVTTIAQWKPIEYIINETFDTYADRTASHYISGDYYTGQWGISYNYGQAVVTEKDTTDKWLEITPSVTGDAHYYDAPWRVVIAKEKQLTLGSTVETDKYLVYEMDLKVVGETALIGDIAIRMGGDGNYAITNFKLGDGRMGRHIDSTLITGLREDGKNVYTQGETAHLKWVLNRETKKYTWFWNGVLVEQNINAQFGGETETPALKYILISVPKQSVSISDVKLYVDNVKLYTLDNYTIYQG